MIDFLYMIPIIFILGVLCASAYELHRETKRKKDKKKCQMDKFNK